MELEAKDIVNQLIGWGLTQVEISSRTEIPQPTISKIARGEPGDVMHRTYRRLEALHKKERRKRGRASFPQEPASTES